MAQPTSITKKNTPPGMVVLRPSRGWASLNLKDLWVYRELIYFLTWRDVLVRYKQTLLGAAWAVLQPVLTMVVFTFFFGTVAKISTGSIPYPIFSYTGLLPWGLFSKAISDAGHSLVTNRNMITKVYFPRLVIPIGSVLGGVVDFAISFGVLIVLMIYYHYKSVGGFQFVLTPAIWTLPLFLLLAIVTAIGVGLWLSAINVIYRDAGYIIPHLTQFWLFLTPIAYPASLISAKWQLVYSLNPMAGVVEGFRWALLGQGGAPGPMIGVSVLIALLILISGLFYFRRMERTFADEI